MLIRIVASAVFAAVGVTLFAADMATKGPVGPLGWITVVCVAIGAIVSVVEYFADRAEQRRQPVREVHNATGIQVLGTFLSDEDGDR